MKKSLLTAAVLLCSAANVQADCQTTCAKFAGGYAGAGLSISGDSAAYKATVGDVDFRAGDSKLGYGAGLFAGWNTMVSNGNFVGVELGVNLDSYNAKDVFNLTDNTGNNFTAFDVNLKKTWGGSLAVRFGHLLSDRTAVTLGLGFEMNRFELKSTNNAAAQTVADDQINFKKTKTKFGVSPRLGLVHHLSDNMFARAEYSMLFSSKVTASQEITGGAGIFNGMNGTTIEHKATPHQHKLTVSLGWRF